MPAKKKKSKPKAKPKNPPKASRALRRARPNAKLLAGKPKEKSLGKVDHYFDKIGVAAMKLGDSLKVGDTIRIEGGSVAFTQQIASMQIEHEPVHVAKKGDEVGFKVKQKVREGYRVYKT